MNGTTLNRYSLKKIREKNAEAPIREALCKRAGGSPLSRVVIVYHNSIRLSFSKVECWGGTCECGLQDCPKQANNYTGMLEPHEKVPRSKGGKLSMENTIMVLRSCHRKLQGREPMWSKGAG